MDSTGSGQDVMAESCERGNEPSGTIKGREFLDHLSTVSFLRTIPYEVSSSAETAHAHY